MFGLVHARHGADAPADHTRTVVAEVMVHSPFTMAFIPGTRFDDARGGKVEMTTRIIGELKVPTGKLHVADPFTTAFDDPGGPLARVAPRGTFPVEAAIARFENGDLRIACVRVRFGADGARASRCGTCQRL